jgi:hypothetical protein
MGRVVHAFGLSARALSVPHPRIRDYKLLRAFLFFYTSFYCKHINHRLVALSALGISGMLAHCDRLIVFCEGDGPGARRSISATAL